MKNLNTGSALNMLHEYQKDLGTSITSTFDAEANNLIELAAIAKKILCAGGNIYLAGNGGSSSQCNHLEAESYYWKERQSSGLIRGSLRSLCANSDILSALANDQSSSQIFSLQLRNLCTSNDGLFVLSTSGNSSNILNALLEARVLGIYTMGILGRDGGQSADHISSLVLVRNSDDTNVIQDVQSALCHCLLKFVYTL